jgi:hypothetical protein
LRYPNTHTATFSAGVSINSTHTSGSDITKHIIEACSRDTVTFTVT